MPSESSKTGFLTEEELKEAGIAHLLLEIDPQRAKRAENRSRTRG